MTQRGFDASANRLGALALRLTDHMASAVTTESGLSLSAATALVAIDGFFAEPPSIDALAPLTERERSAFEPIVDSILIALVQGPRPGPAMCRLCATDVCGAEPGQPCPVTLAALQLEGGEP